MRGPCQPIDAFRLSGCIPNRTGNARRRVAGGVCLPAASRLALRALPARFSGEGEAGMTTTLDPILVVDDNPELLDLIQILISNAGYQAVTTQHSTQALELAKTRHFSAL